MDAIYALGSDIEPIMSKSMDTDELSIYTILIPNQLPESIFSFQLCITQKYIFTVVDRDNYPIGHQESFYTLSTTQIRKKIYKPKYVYISFSESDFVFIPSETNAIILDNYIPQHAEIYENIKLTYIQYNNSISITTCSNKDNINERDCLACRWNEDANSFNSVDMYTNIYAHTIEPDICKLSV